MSLCFICLIWGVTTLNYRQAKKVNRVSAHSSTLKCRICALDEKPAAQQESSSALPASMEALVAWEWARSVWGSNYGSRETPPVPGLSLLGVCPLCLHCCLGPSSDSLPLPTASWGHLLMFLSKIFSPVALQGKGIFFNSKYQGINFQEMGLSCLFWVSHSRVAEQWVYKHAEVWMHPQTQDLFSSLLCTENTLSWEWHFKTQLSQSW